MDKGFDKSLERSNGGAKAKGGRVVVVGSCTEYKVMEVRRSRQILIAKIRNMYR